MHELDQYNYLTWFTANIFLRHAGNDKGISLLLVRWCAQAAQPSELGAKAAVGQAAVETVAG